MPFLYTYFQLPSYSVGFSFWISSDLILRDMRSAFSFSLNLSLEFFCRYISSILNPRGAPVHIAYPFTSSQLPSILDSRDAYLKVFPRIILP